MEALALPATHALLQQRTLPYLFPELPGAAGRQSTTPRARARALRHLAFRELDVVDPCAATLALASRADGAPTSGIRARTPRMTIEEEWLMFAGLGVG